MKKLSITLKQHTPLLHFQHYEEGATLRATEVKPKLDRFVWEKWEAEEGGKEQAYTKYCNFLIGYPNSKLKKKFDNGFRALNYKVSIIASENVEINTNTYPSILANIGKNESERKELVFHNSIELRIISHHQPLKEILKKHIIEFVAKTNFGNRKTKGYGSFSVHSINNIDIEFSAIEQCLKGISYLEINTQNPIDIHTVIDYYWKYLKSGINYPEKDRVNKDYKKSFLLQYLSDAKNSLNYTWEKPWIKQTFMGGTAINTNAKFARALLGLNPKYEFKGKPKPINKDSFALIDKYGFTLSTKNAEIERIESPLIFKPICLYGSRLTKIFIIIPDEADNLDVFSKQFEFTYSNTNSHQGIPKAASLITPMKSEFPKIKELVAAFNKSIGASFIARDYSGRQKLSVSIKTQQ